MARKKLTLIFEVKREKMREEEVRGLIVQTLGYRNRRKRDAVHFLTFREHDIVVLNHDGKAENITGFPVGPEHNVVT